MPSAVIVTVRGVLLPLQSTDSDSDSDVITSLRHSRAFSPDSGASSIVRPDKLIVSRLVSTLQCLEHLDPRGTQWQEAGENMRWVGHVARLREMTRAFKSVVLKPEEKT
jgi:hypothetical protein